LVEGIIDHLVHHASGQPVRGVVLTEPLADLRGDHRLIQRLEHVVIHIGPPERRDPTGDIGDDFPTIGSVEYPVKEPGLPDPQQPSPLKELARDEDAGLMTRRVEIEADDGVADQGCQEDQVRVFDKQLIGVVELRPQRTMQQLGPQLPLQRNSWSTLAAPPTVQQRGL
jgi:hypothetical protein